MKPKLAIVTSNPLKFTELALALRDHFDCEQKEFEGLYEIQGTPEEILQHKMREAYVRAGMPVLVDDVSLHLEALNGFPGSYIKDFSKAIPPAEMGKRYAGTRVEVFCRIGLVLSDEKQIVAVGSFRGDIVEPHPGVEHPWNFDICVRVDGTDKVMDDYTSAEKNTFSHRGLAIKNLLEQL
jgi:non-canonical purine NTP pyrophosphatase (RdgB/HAM1 family)